MGALGPPYAPHGLALLYHDAPTAHVLHTRGSISPVHTRGGGCTQAECVHTLKGLALPRASHSSEIALVGSPRLCSTLAAEPVLFAHAVVTIVKKRTSATPSSYMLCFIPTKHAQ